MGKVRELLEQGRYDVNCVDSLGRTPLHVAASWRYLGVVKVLISEFGANVDAKTKHGETSFHREVFYGSMAMALTLMNEFDCDTFGGTPFIHKACSNGWLDLVRALVHKHGVGILNHCDGSGKTPLQEAVMCGWEEIAVVLITEYNCDSTPIGIHEACRKCWLYLVRALVHKHGVGILNHCDSNGNTPLHEAARWGRKEVAMMLINCHCDTSVKGHKGRSLLHSACAGGDVSLIRKPSYLSKKGSITARDDEDNTPLHVAAEHGRKDVLLALVSEFDPACSLWMVNSAGDTPLHTCSRRGHVGCVQILLKFNPPVMIRNSSGKTPRNVAHKDVVKYFNAYMSENKDKMYSQYESHSKHMQKKKVFPLLSCITRVFVIGNPGAGKSSLIQALKREGFFSFTYKGV